MDLINVLEISDEVMRAICTGDGATIMNTVNKILTLIQIAVPILLVVFGSIDLAKAVMAGKEDEIKKSQNTFVKRLIAAVIVFFIPLVVNVVLGLVTIEGNNGESLTWNECKNYNQQ